jgi:segregation and condensation protein A
VTSSAPPGQFSVDVPLFSGPFRLLADLILEQKLDVCDVPVSTITDRYLERGMRAIGEWDMEEATWFLAVCAVLLELKVGRLLPRATPLDTEEDLLGTASPDLVYARSLELAAFRRVAERLSELIAEAARLVPRNIGPSVEFAHVYPDVMAKITAEDLAGTARDVMAHRPEIDLSHVTPIRASLADALDTLRERLSTRREALFRELLEDCEDRIEIVIRFLAILELYREGKVELEQAAMFGDIEVRWMPSG